MVYLLKIVIFQVMLNNQMVSLYFDSGRSSIFSPPQGRELAALRLAPLLAVRSGRGHGDWRHWGQTMGHTAPAGSCGDQMCEI